MALPNLPTYEQAEFLCAKALGWKIGDPRPDMPPAGDFKNDPLAAALQVSEAIPDYKAIEGLALWINAWFRSDLVPPRPNIDT